MPLFQMYLVEVLWGTMEVIVLHPTNAQAAEELAIAQVVAVKNNIGKKSDNIQDIHMRNW